MFSYLNSKGIDKFTFYRMPKILFTDRFAEISCEAKVLYGLLLDRATLSKNNGWIDENDRVYVFFKQSEVMECLNIKKNKTVAIFKELDDVGLIIRKKIGQGNPTRIYVMNFSEDKVDEATETQTSTENTKKEVKRFEKQTSEIQTSAESTKREVKRFEKQTSKGLKNKLNSSNYINNTERNNNSFFLSDGAEKPTSEFPLNSSEIVERKEENDNQPIVENIKEQISYAYLLSSGKDKSTLDLIVSIIADIYSRYYRNSDSSETIVINCSTIYVSNVMSVFKKLDHSHIEYVFERIEEVSKEKKIKNTRSYLQTCLYNAPFVMDTYYDMQVNYDMHNPKHKQE